MSLLQSDLIIDEDDELSLKRVQELEQAHKVAQRLLGVRNTFTSEGKFKHGRAAEDIKYGDFVEVDGDGWFFKLKRLENIAGIAVSPVFKDNFGWIQVNNLPHNGMSCEWEVPSAEQET